MNEFEKRDPGTYTGHDPELAPEKVPGGVQPPDEGSDSRATEPDRIVKVEGTVNSEDAGAGSER